MNSFETLAARLPVPIIAAPMAGGPSTPALVAAVADAGGSGFLAAGYRTAQEMSAQIAEVRSLTERPFGVNLFVPNDDPVDDAALEVYRRSLLPTASEFELDELPSHKAETEDWDAKLAALQENPVPMVSFTFGLPDADVVGALQAVGTCVLATVTSLSEARAAEQLGYDGLVVQGPDAGGHRGTHHTSTEPDRTPLLSLLAHIVQSVDLPIIAAGGLSAGSSIADALAFADAVQLGTAFLDADEAGTSAIHRAALRDPRFTETAVTRCFTGRFARGLRNDFIDRFDHDAPAAYPAVHQVTQPLRKAATAANDPRFVHLWAGTGWRDLPSGGGAQITNDLWRAAQEQMHDA